MLSKGFTPEHAEKFHTGFKEAQNYALKRGVMVEYSGVRLEELHSTYCDVSRNTIRLTPDGILRNCFCRFSENKDFTLGQINKNSLKIRDDIHETLRKTLEIPEECTNCINIYHCSRGCPDYCLFEPDKALNAFKCNLHKHLTVNSLKDIADSKTALNEK